VTRTRPSPDPAKKSTPARASAAAKGAAASTAAPARSAVPRPGPPPRGGPTRAATVSATTPTPGADGGPSGAEAAAFADALTRDPVGQVLLVLAAESEAAGSEAAGSEALGAGAIKQRLIARGASTVTADRAWGRAQEKVRFNDHVVFENKTYRWIAAARSISPAEAVYQLARGGDAGQRSGWLSVIQAALEAGLSDPVQLAEARSKIAEAERRIGSLEQELAKLNAAPPEAARAPAPPPPPAAPVEAAVETPVEPAAEGTVHDQYDRAERRRLARERQARIDAMSTVAELAAEVEELTAKRASAEVLLEHTRALTGDRGLEAIGRAGEPSPYDETRHDPVGDVPAEGEPVIVIRPGYLWHAPGEAVLISRALVKRK
jgi:hypothetical protein